MPLTPEDVSNKRFTPVRLREGYDMGEVDQFLDEVEAELDGCSRRTTTSAPSSPQPRTATPATARSRCPHASLPEQAEREGRGEAGRHRRARARGREAAEVPAAVTAPRETIKVVTAAEASKAALRLLELATNNADEVVAEAKEEAVADRRHGPHRRRAPGVRDEGQRRAAGGRDQGQDRQARARGTQPRPATSTRRPRPSAPSCSATWSGRGPASTARSRTSVPSSASTAAA